MNAILFIATLALIGSLASAQYCNQRKEAAVDKCGSHSTLCLYPRNQPGPLCIKNSREVYTLTEEEKKIIVRKHNELRRKVASGQEKLGNPGPQPKAISMPDLVWDQEIANVAQRWAYQCDFGHDQCRNTDKYQCGQNVARLGTTDDFSTMKVEEMVQNWYNEVQFYPNSAVSQFRSTAPAVTGHYTQLVWAKSTKIGCGAAKYYGDTYKYFYLVCNYGPAGNFIGEPIYDTGAKPPAAANPKVEYQRPRQLPSNVVNTPNTARVPNVGSRLPNSFNVQQYFQQNGANTFKLPANVANIFGLNSNSFNPASLIQNGVNRIPTSQNGVTYNTERRFYYNVQ